MALCSKITHNYLVSCQTNSSIYQVQVTNFYVWPGMTSGTLCFRVVRPSVCPSVRHTLGVPLCVQRPAKTMPFQQISMHALQYKHEIDCTSYFVFDLNLLITCSWGVFNLDFLHRSSLMGTTLRAAPSKSYAFSTNFHTFIAMPTWHRCAPPILFWPWSPYNLLTRSCLSWYFFFDPHWCIPLCVKRPAKVMPFQQMIINELQCQHDIDVPPILFWPWS